MRRWNSGSKLWSILKVRDSSLLPEGQIFDSLWWKVALWITKNRYIYLIATYLLKNHWKVSNMFSQVYKFASVWIWLTFTLVSSWNSLHPHGFHIHMHTTVQKFLEALDRYLQCYKIFLLCSSFEQLVYQKIFHKKYLSIVFDTDNNKNHASWTSEESCDTEKWCWNSALHPLLTNKQLQLQKQGQYFFDDLLT